MSGSGVSSARMDNTATRTAVAPAVTPSAPIAPNVRMNMALPSLAHVPVTTITLVTVVFEAERDLLRLQAASVAAHLMAEVARIYVIDNTARGLNRRYRQVLRATYGSFAPSVEIVRSGDIAAVPRTTGWRTQQILKLLIAERVTTDWYLVLDAKVQFIDATTLGSFFAANGTPRGGIHSYTRHPLLPVLATVLDYERLRADGLVESFTSTTTPFVVNTATAQALVADVGSRSRSGFAQEFESSGLTEFFLYTAWQISHGRRIDELTTGEPIESPTIWPRFRSATEIQRVLEAAETGTTTTLAVHRTSLARMDAEARRELAAFWQAHALFNSKTAAQRFIRSFRRRYIPAMLAKKLRELGRQGRS